MKVKRKFLIEEGTKLHGKLSKCLLICRTKHNVCCQYSMEDK